MSRKARSEKVVRCAIYTRVSTDAGLEQDFNSLDAQYDASQAYIKSQAHAGWTLIRARYDDGGYSGGTIERPALQKLLSDIREKKIDVIVVYKVDRLTRSLADFAKLVELFDAHGVSFVSVTQHFNTTTSMGRLTLNVLLSFAQFEREVTSERIRDKIAASKRKGIWVGGMVPLGYRVKDRKLEVVKEEAERVRTIFRRYLELGSIDKLMVDLRKRKILTKIRPLSTGKTIGGIPFTRGPLAHLLRNRFYVGEVFFKGEVCPGEQPAILDRALFDAVQAKLADQRTHQTTPRQSSDALLMGRIFDDRGNRMTPTHGRKAERRHRYYISAPLLNVQPDRTGSVRRVPAIEVEKLVAKSIREHFRDSVSADDRDLVSRYLLRVEVQPDQLAIALRSQKVNDVLESSSGKLKHPSEQEAAPIPISIPWQKTSAKRRREIIPPAPSSASRTDPRPIRSETRAALIKSIACGMRWLDQLITGVVADVDAIAAREGCSARQVNMTISLAFLAPGLVTAAINGELPRGIGVERLRDPSAEWSRQFELLGLSYSNTAN